MQRDASFAIGEAYHLYNRGAHKQNIFKESKDYDRFLLLLHLCNTDGKVDLRALFRKYKGQTFAQIFEDEKPDKSLVSIYSYTLMPNHFHVVLQQKAEKGITTFMRKVLTAYSMYFNLKYDHSGIVSQGAFKSRHVSDESYFRYIFSYVHLNPLSLTAPNWEEAGIGDEETASNFISSYKYSSFYDYSVAWRPERSLLAYAEAPDFLKTQNDLQELYRWYETAKV